MVVPYGLPLATSRGTEESSVDFGEILKLWDDQSRPAARPDAPKPARRRNEAAEGARNTVARAQSEWLERHGVPEPGSLDKDVPPEPRLSRRDIDEMPIDASLDLHGMTSLEAEAALSSFFASAERSGCRKVMIVHGKGLHSASEPVLERVMKRWLEKRASAGKTGHADATNGGKGATWVLLKAKGNQRSR